MAKTEMMPSDACQIFYECTGCRAVLRPERGEAYIYVQLQIMKPMQESGTMSSGEEPLSSAIRR